MTHSRSLTLVYDADCRFCIRSLAVLKRLDWFRLLDLVPSAEANRYDRLRDALAGADLQSAMYAVSARGHSYGGFEAFRQALLRLPLGALVVWAWYLPGARWLGTRCYGWVSQRRRHFGCSSSCAKPN